MIEDVIFLIYKLACMAKDSFISGLTHESYAVDSIYSNIVGIGYQITTVQRNYRSIVHLRNDDMLFSRSIKPANGTHFANECFGFRQYHFSFLLTYSCIVRDN